MATMSQNLTVSTKNEFIIMDYPTLKDKFNKIYENLPEGARNEICAVHDGKSYTFRTVNDEVQKDSQKALPLLDSLYNLDIIK